MRVTLALAVALALASLTGCGGAVGNPNKPPPASVDFVSAVQVSPTVASPGRRISVNIDVKNTGNLALLADVDLLVHAANGVEIYSQTWEGVHFDASEDWNLTQSFLTATNTNLGTASVELVIRGQDDDAIYYDEPKVAQFEVSTTATATDGGISK